MKTTIILSTTLLVSARMLLACWAQPAAVEVEGSDGRSDYIIRRFNEEKKIEIRRASDLELAWNVPIKDFDILFSSFYLSKNGTILYHVFENHCISDLSQTCIEVYTKEGFRQSYSARELTSKLIPADSSKSSSISPEYEWLNRVVGASDVYLELSMADGSVCFVWPREHKVAKE